MFKALREGGLPSSSLQQHGHLNILSASLSRTPEKKILGVCSYFWGMFVFLIGITRKRNFLQCISQVTKYCFLIIIFCWKTIYLRLKFFKHLYCVHNSTFLICHHNLQTTFCSLNVHTHKTIFSLWNTAIQTAYFKRVSVGRPIFFLTEL